MFSYVYCCIVKLSFRCECCTFKLVIKLPAAVLFLLTCFVNKTVVMLVQTSECCNHCCELLRDFLSVHVDPCGFGSSGSFGILDGLPVLYCMKSETYRMTSNDVRSLLSQRKMDDSTTKSIFEKTLAPAN